MVEEFTETFQKVNVVSEKYPIFIGFFWTKLFSSLGNQLAHNSYYQPQFDGKNKIVNKYL